MTKNPVFDFRGLDHIALTISDMKRSVDFYHGVLGMPVLHTLEYADAEGEIIGQHWFMGVDDPSNPDAHVALFWWRDGFQTLTKEQIDTGVRPKNKIAKPIGSLIHLNFRVAPENLRPYALKLTEKGIPFRHVTRYAADNSEMQASGLVNIGMRGITTRNSYHEPEPDWLMNSVYVIDPDGIEVEFNSWAPEWRNWPATGVPRSK